MDLYLIKDELFTNKSDRVKFFDEIIPIVPFINTTNSFDKLREIFKCDDVDDRILRILSRFVDDFRLLLNIHNEYLVYSNIATTLENRDVSYEQRRERNELLALIAYKNIHPDQFDNLQNGLLNMTLTNLVKFFIRRINKKLILLKIC